jgi:predicted amidohydrolase
MGLHPWHRAHSATPRSPSVDLLPCSGGKSTLDGARRRRYRNLFPWQPQEGCSRGDEFVTFDAPGVGRIGLSICYDGSFPETCRQLAWLGAEVVLQPSLTTTTRRRPPV